MKITSSLSLLTLSAVLAGCATQQPVFESFQPQNFDEAVKSGRLVQKTDNLFVVIDASSSMDSTYKNQGYPAQPDATKFDVEKEILSRMNQSIPNIRLNSGMRSFGFGSCMDWEFTKLNKPLETHSKEAFASSLDSLKCAGGGTPMTKALDELQHDLASASGRTALLLLSDGHDSSSKAPDESLQALKKRFGQNLCVYSVWVGNDNDDDGHRLMQRLADISLCGFTVDAADIASAGDMSGFVQRVLFEAGQPVDECSLDNDGDGVNNCLDKCPDTPKGAHVDATGCWAYHGVLFDFDKATIKPEFDQMLHNGVEVMQLNPGLTVSIEGHTDSIGSDDYNQKLSEKRAHAVMKYLVDHGVAPSRMEAHGFGESQPIDSNETEEGRYNNRRVTFKRTDR